jgi:sugar phosphate isomerase/epimerase
MIYVSSSCVRFGTIKESVEFLAQQGFSNIELSGGTQLYDNLESDLLELKDKYNLNYLCHNYFPPPPEAFVLNIASLDDKVSEMSTQHIINSLELSKRIGADQFAFHAGFLINIPVSEIGKKIQQQTLFNREEAVDKFCSNYQIIEENNPEVKLYIENNVLSKTNFESYEGVNPFFITDFGGLQEFTSKINTTPLIDVAHLKVSCNTLGLDFETQLKAFVEATDYVHISDNDGLSDSNQTFKKDSDLFRSLSHLDLRNKTITLEVYTGMDDLKSSYENTLALL